MKDIKLKTDVDVDNPDLVTGFWDIELNRSGNNADVGTLEGSDRISQMITKALYTPRGILPYVNYGVGIDTVQGARMDTAIMSTLYDAIKQSLYYMMYMEESTATNEVIDSINHCNISFAGRQLTLDMEIQLASQETATAAAGV